MKTFFRFIKLVFKYCWIAWKDIFYTTFKETWQEAKIKQRNKNLTDWQTQLEYALLDKLTGQEKKIIRNNVELIVSQIRLQTLKETLEALKLWRPYFYRDFYQQNKITDEDIKNLPKIIGLK